MTFASEADLSRSQLVAYDDVDDDGCIRLTWSERVLVFQVRLRALKLTESWKEPS